MLPVANAADVLVATNWAEALARLGEGGKVFFTPPADMLDDSCPPLANRPIFWNRIMNNTGRRGLPAEGFLGLLVDSQHPALAGFPTENYCDWQWTEIVNGVRAINVENAPLQLQPIVQAIDDWNRGFKLGVVFECNVAVNGRTGKLLVSAIDPQSDPRNVVGRQLVHSLLDYAGSGTFSPRVTLTTDQANALWPSTRPARFKSPAMPTRSTIPNYNPGDVQEEPPAAFGEGGGPGQPQ